MEVLQVHSVKQIIGRNFMDVVVAHTLAQRSWGFKVFEGPAGECRISGEACGTFHRSYMRASLAYPLSSPWRPNLPAHLAWASGTLVATQGDWHSCDVAMPAIAVPSMVGGPHDGAVKGLRPEDVSAAILRQLLVNARKLHNVHAAVITVPATFTIPQRMATFEAAQLAGIQVRCS